MPDDTRSAYIQVILAAANHPDAGWRIEGSSDWANKPGRLTVWIDLAEDEWDTVYDALNYDEDDTISLQTSESPLTPLTNHTKTP